MSESKNSSALSDRISRASKIINVPESTLVDSLQELGITNDDLGFKILNSSVAYMGLIEGAVTDSWVKTYGLGKRQPETLITIAAIIIKEGRNPLEVEETDAKPVKSYTAETIVAALPDRPVEQLSTKDLLSKFLEEYDIDVEAELIKRSKGKRFLVVTGQNDEVDQEASLGVLKRARRGEDIPHVFVGPDNKAIHVYTVIEYSPESRIVEVSHFDGHTPLFNGYCSISEMNLEGISDELKSFIFIIGVLNQGLTKSERREIVKAARKGEEELSELYPLAAAHFRDKKSVNDLVSLRLLRDPEIRGNGKAHPFKPYNGNY